MSIIQTIIIVILVPLITSILVAKRTNEYAIRKSFYDNNINSILKYYSIYYKYYRLCQQAMGDVIVEENGNNITSTRDIYILNLNGIVNDLSNIEGKIRLILPNNILDVHNELLQYFNNFRDTMMSYSIPEGKPYEKLEFDFKEIDKSKNKLEKLLKEYLRSEKVI